MDLGQFLVFIGTPAFVDYIVSNVLDQIPAFVNLKGEVKSLITLFLAIFFAVVSYVLVKNVTPAEISQWQQLFTLVSAMFVAWASGQIQHEFIANAVTRRNARTELIEAAIEAGKRQLASGATPAATMVEIIAAAN